MSRSEPGDKSADDADDAADVDQGRRGDGMRKRPLALWHILFRLSWLQPGNAVSLVSFPFSAVTYLL